MPQGIYERKLPQWSKDLTKETDERIRIRSEKIWTEKNKKKHSIRMSGKNNPFYGKTHSEETLKKLRIKLKGKFIGEKNPFFGRKHTEEYKRKMSETKKRFYKENPDILRKMSEIHKLQWIENPHLRENMSHTLKKGWHSDSESIGKLREGWIRKNSEFFNKNPEALLKYLPIEKRKLKHRVWNKGLTKDSNARMKRFVESLQKTYDDGRIGWNKGKHWSKETKEKMKNAAEKNI